MKFTQRRLLALSLLAALVLIPGCGGDGEPESKDPRTVISESSPGVAKILGKHDDFNSESTGFVYDAGPPARVLTDATDVDGEVEFKVKLGDDGSFVSAELAGIAPCADVAVLELSESPSGVTALPFGDSAALENGAPIVQLGFVGDAELNTAGELERSTVTATEGTIQNPNLTTVEYSTERPVLPTLFQHSIEPDFGINGAPLLDEFGEVVGVTIYSPDGEGRYALPIDAVEGVLPDLAAGSGPGYLGLDLGRLGDVSEQYRVNDYIEKYGFDEAQAKKDVRFDERNLDGLYVKAAVAAGSPAEGKVYAGDLITEIDGQKVRTVGDLCEIIGAKMPGESIEASGVSLTSLGKYTPDYDEASFKETIALPPGSATTPE